MRPGPQIERFRAGTQHITGKRCNYRRLIEDILIAFGMVLAMAAGFGIATWLLVTK